MVASGALTQLAAAGPQDLFLTCSPDMTFFKGGYKRHTRFAVAEMEQCPQSAVGFGRSTCWKVDRNGDLVGKVYLRATLPAITSAAFGAAPAATDGVYYTNAVGHAMIEEVCVNIGGHEMDKHTGEFLEIWETISAAPEKRLTEMTGFSQTIAGLQEFARRDQVLHVPLAFWFNRFYDLHLPIIAMQYHEVQFKLKFRRLDQLGIEVGAYVNMTSLSVPNSTPEIGAAPTIDDAVLLINYVYLDTVERRMFAQQAHEYLINQVQFIGSESHTASAASQSLRLNFNHPTVELLWVGQRDTAQPGLNDNATDVIMSNTPFQGNDHFNWSGVPAVVETYPGSGVFSTFQTDTITNGQILLNGHERTINHPATYFRNVQPWERHSRIPDKHIYNYCFSLYPENWKPSGSVNLSRIDNVNLRLAFDNSMGATGGAWNGSIRVYARSYNVIKVVSGMVGLMYAN